MLVRKMDINYPVAVEVIIGDGYSIALSCGVSHILCRRRKCLKNVGKVGRYHILICSNFPPTI